ncbi:MAG: DUF58 domain-containing protein [Spirochaetales bacterium]|nr:DUF58 domain-containing protein [Spirochaetales bacterium]
MKITWERVIPALLILSISFLAARYLGTIYYVLFRSVAFLLVLDLVMLIRSYNGLRYNQNFTSEHLVRGDEIRYNFYLVQSKISTTNLIHVEFYPFNNPEMKDLEPVCFSLRPQEKKNFSYTIQGGTRGIYVVGIKRLVMEDFLGFFKLSLPRHERTFYIFPRLFRGKNYPLKQTAGGGDRVWKKGGYGEETAFSNLKEYRPGMALRGISWKHFARYGYPVVRENESSLRPGRIIMADLRPLGGERHREDSVLEAVLTLTRRIIDNGESVILDGFDRDEPLDIAYESSFESLYKSTLNIQFDAPYLPLYREPSDAVTLISALPEWDLLEESFWQHRDNWQLVALLEGMEEKQAETTRDALKKLISRGVNITIVEKGEKFWTQN